jgi:hypothetical protein
LNFHNITDFKIFVEVEKDLLNNIKKYDQYIFKLKKTKLVTFNN